MQSITVFLDIVKCADLRRKNADVSRTLGVCQVIHIFLDLLWVRYNCAKFHHCRICATDFRERGLFGRPPPSLSSPEKAHLEQGQIRPPYFVPGTKSISLHTPLYFLYDCRYWFGHGYVYF